MKLRTYIVIFITAFAGTFFLASCLNEENKIPPNCYDGVLNNNENPEGYVDFATGLPMFDCGGPCEPCDHCANNVFEPQLDEEWLDCGGDCAPCQPCANGIMDGDEVAIDCGGSCGGCEQLCFDGLLNGFEDQIDCENFDDEDQGGCNFCPTCIDGILNGDETGIDCGGPDCEPCCSTGSCTNGITDGVEFNYNCGGTICNDCPDTLTWKIGSTNFYCPSALMTVNAGVNTLSFTSCPALELGESPFPLGAISLLVTEPVNSWAPNFGIPLEFPPLDQTAYFIEFVDEFGETYSTSNLDGEGKITMIKVATVIVPDDDFDGCHKPAGTYDYYRGTFSGSLTNADPEIPPVNCTLGTFQVTFFTP